MTREDFATLPDVRSPASAPRIRWLELDDRLQAAEYDQLWRDGGHRRPHDCTAYLELVRPPGHAAAAVVYDHSPRTRIVYPFFYCNLGNLPGFQEMDPAVHIVSPYGYGGPLYEGDPAQQADASLCFDRLFRKMLDERHVVSEFVREDLFPHRLASRSCVAAIEQQENIVVRLQREPDEIWRGYKSNVRSNVRRAERYGLRVRFDEDARDGEAFVRMYYDTMKRRRASAFFFMPPARFEALANHLRTCAGIMYVHVYDGVEEVASELVLIGDGIMYSFLAASAESAFGKRPNDLMRHEIIRWGSEHGMHSYVLGGGATPGDGIFGFKQGFDPGGMVPFRLRKIVHDAECCQALLAHRRRIEAAAGNVGWQPRPEFFPDYLS